MDTRDRLIVIDLRGLVPHLSDYPYLTEPWFLALVVLVFAGSIRTAAPGYTCLLSTVAFLVGYWAVGGTYMAGRSEGVFDLLSIHSAETAGGYASIVGLLLVNVFAHTRELQPPISEGPAEPYSYGQSGIYDDPAGPDGDASTSSD